MDELAQVREEERQRNLRLTNLLSRISPVTSDCAIENLQHLVEELQRPQISQAITSLTELVPAVKNYVSDVEKYTEKVQKTVEERVIFYHKKVTEV